MAWNVQIRESYSYTTENQPVSSSTSTTPSEYAQLHQHLQSHVQGVMKSLGDFAITPPTSPTATKIIPFNKVNIARCQEDLIWDLPNDIWTDDIEDWLMNIPFFDTTEISGSSSSSTTSSEQWKRKFPSLEIPNYDLFTNTFWQQEYSPSIYSQDELGVLYPIRDATRQLQQVLAEAPIDHINLADILAITPKMQEVISEIQATTQKAEDSTEFDSNSDVSMLDLDATSPPSTNFYQIARSRSLIISTSSPSSSNGDLPSPAHNFPVRDHHISPGIHTQLS
jgi:hypothetical protein